MKYYFLTNSLNLDEIGIYEQSISCRAKGGLNDLGELEGIPETAIMPEPIINPEAKLSSYIYTTIVNNFVFLILKSSFVDFLNEFNLNNFTRRKLNIYQNNNLVTDYELFHLSKPMDSKLIKYKECVFTIGKLGDWKDKSQRKEAIINSYQDYRKLLDHIRYLQDGSQLYCKKMVFDFSNIKEDIIRIGDVRFWKGYYVSEKLKEVIQEKGYTGMEFKEINEMNNGIEVVY